MMNRGFYMLTQREMTRFFRQRSRVIGALATPLFFWIMLGLGMGSSFVSPDGSRDYFRYFFPGTLLLSVLFTGIFANISVIQDRTEGFLQGVLVSPLSRFQILFSKLAGATLIALFQAAAFLVVAFFLNFPFSLISFLGMIALLGAAGLGLNALGLFFAWTMNSVQGFHGIMNLILMPLWILSGALFPSEGAQGVFPMIMKLNPLYYSLEGLRSLLTTGDVSLQLFLMGIFAPVALGTVCFSVLLRKK